MTDTYLRNAVRAAIARAEQYGRDHIAIVPDAARWLGFRFEAGDSGYEVGPDVEAALLAAVKREVAT